MNICKTCRKPNPAFKCGLCTDSICKSCAQFMDEASFSFMKKVPKELTHSIYCTVCFDDKVAAPLAEYNDLVEKAKDVIVYTKAQTKLTRLVDRKAPPVSVEDCEDEQETLVRLSFFAAQQKHNAIVDVEMKTKKIIVGSHKKTIFSATAIPATIDPTRLRGHVDDY